MDSIFETLDHATIVSLLEEDPKLIKHVKNPSEELCLLAVQKDPN